MDFTGEMPVRENRKGVRIAITPGCQSDQWDERCGGSFLDRCTVEGKFSEAARELQVSQEHAYLSIPSVLRCWPGAARGKHDLGAKTQDDSAAVLTLVTKCIFTAATFPTSTKFLLSPFSV